MKPEDLPKAWRDRIARVGPEGEAAMRHVLELYAKEQNQRWSKFRLALFEEAWNKHVFGEEVFERSLKVA